MNDRLPLWGNLVLFGLAALVLGGCGKKGPQQVEETTPTQPHQGSTSETNSSGQSKVGTRPSPGWGEMAEIGARKDQFSLEMSPPIIRANGRGEALAAWTVVNKDGESQHPTLYAAIYRDYAWQGAFVVSEEPARDPKIAINDQGDMAIAYARVVYDAKKLSHSEEWWVRRSENGQWTTAERIGHAEPTGLGGQYAKDARLGIDSEGQVLVVFQQFGPMSGLFFAYFSQRQWSPPSLLDRQVPSHVHTFDLALNEQGRGMVAWLGIHERVHPKDKDEKQDVLTLKTQVFSQGKWSESSEEFGEVLSTDFAGIYAPSVAVDAQGNALTMFTEERESEGRSIRTRYYSTKHQSWTPVQVLAPANGKKIDTRGYLAMNAKGDAIAAWQVDLPEDKLGVRMSYLQAGQSTWATPLDPVEHESTVNGHIRVALGNEGPAWVGWSQPKANVERSMHLRAHRRSSGFEPIRNPLAGERLELAAGGGGEIFALSRRTVINNSPLGYFSVPTVAIYTP